MRHPFSTARRILALAWSNLAHSPSRLILSIGTVAAAGLLMFTQLGFLDASLESQGRIVSRLHPDLVLVSRARASLISLARFPLRLLVQARSIQGVRDATPLYVETRRHRLRNPQTGRRYFVRVMALDPASKVLPGSFPSGTEEVDSLLIDLRSKPMLGVFRPGAAVELDQHRYRIRGTFRLGSDFVNDGNVLMTTRNLLRLLPKDRADARLEQVDIGLVSLAPGVSSDAILREIRGLLPPDVQAMTLTGFLSREREFWRDHTIIGFVFTLGTVVGLLVGTIICAQLLYSIVSEFRRQFATLNAMGFRHSFTIGVVCIKSLILAIGGFVFAWSASFALYRGLSWFTGLTFALNGRRTIEVFGLTVLMTLIAALASLRPLLREDPADLFKD